MRSAGPARTKSGSHRLDLNEVRMFVQVVRARSFAEAARRLAVPPNTLSRRIRQLEATLDTRLMQRSTRKLTLTAAGQAFFDRCAAAVDVVLEAGKALVGGGNTPSGLVRVAAPLDFLDIFHIEWVVEFFGLHPAVRLEFVLNDARADLIDEAIDVAFRAGSARDSGTAFRPARGRGFQYNSSQPRSGADCGRGTHRVCKCEIANSGCGTGGRHFATPPQGGQKPMTVQGKWNITVKTPVGDKAGVLELRCNGSTLSGRISNPDHVVDFSDGKIDGDQLEWSAKLAKPVRMTLKFTARVEANRIEGKAQHLLGSATFCGTRASD